MKQIYNQHWGINESAYKLAVRVYKEAQILTDYHDIRSL